MFWDFLTLRPESMHQVMITFSDRGIPDGFRHMNGYGSHAFKLVNKDEKEFYAKFHFKVNIYICVCVFVSSTSFSPILHHCIDKCFNQCFHLALSCVLRSHCFLVILTALRFFYDFKTFWKHMLRLTVKSSVDSFTITNFIFHNFNWLSNLNCSC